MYSGLVRPSWRTPSFFLGTHEWCVRTPRYTGIETRQSSCSLSEGGTDHLFSRYFGLLCSGLLNYQNRDGTKRPRTEECIRYSTKVGRELRESPPSLSTRQPFDPQIRFVDLSWRTSLSPTTGSHPFLYINSCPWGFRMKTGDVGGGGWGWGRIWQKPYRISNYRQ